MKESDREWFRTWAKEAYTEPALVLGTLKGMLACEDLNQREIVARCRFFLAEVEKAKKGVTPDALYSGGAGRDCGG